MQQNQTAASQVEAERCRDINHGLDQAAFEAAWAAFQNTPIDVLADSDDEQCRCVANAIKAYLAQTEDQSRTQETNE